MCQEVMIVLILLEFKFFVDSRIVSDAFETCNVSKTGKLSAKVCV